LCIYIGGILGLACEPWELFSGPLFSVKKFVDGLAWFESSISNGEKRFCVRKKDVLASDESRALAVFLDDLNSSSEFGDGGFESS